MAFHAGGTAPQKTMHLKALVDLVADPELTLAEKIKLIRKIFVEINKTFFLGQLFVVLLKLLFKLLHLINNMSLFM